MNMKKMKYFALLLVLLAAVFVAMAFSPQVTGGIRQGTVITYTDSIPDTLGADTINGLSGSDFTNFTTITDVITIYHWGGDSTAAVCYMQVSNDQAHWITLDSAYIPASGTKAIEADSAMVVKDWSTYGAKYRYSRWINAVRDLGTVFSDSTITVHKIFIAE
jgi:hypothetical protein